MVVDLKGKDEIIKLESNCHGIDGHCIALQATAKWVT